MRRQLALGLALLVALTVATRIPWVVVGVLAVTLCYATTAKRSAKVLKPLLVLVVFLLVATAPALGGIVNITPVAPPGVGGALNTILNWIYWIALVACVIFAIVFGVQFFTGGDVNAKNRALIFAIVALFLFFLPQILHALSSYF